MTAVEWLIDRLEVNKIIPNPYPGEYWNLLKRHALEMEEEQKNKMTEKEKIEIVKDCFEEVIWMAIRYADGRHTYAPSSVRRAINQFQKVFPDWEPKKDSTIDKPTEDMIKGISFESDYLWDLVESKSK